MVEVDIPEMRKCCGCIPLRSGLLTLAYMKLVSVLLLLGVRTTVTVNAIGVAMIEGNYSIIQLMLYTAVWIVLFIDACFDVSFLIGLHRKSVKIMRINYMYTIVGTGLFALFMAGSFIYNFIFYIRMDIKPHIFIKIILNIFFSSVGLIGILLYFVVLISSEMTKMKNANVNDDQSTVEDGININIDKKDNI